MATISNAMVSMTINSSYVLISLIPSARLGTDNEPPVGCLASILCVNYAVDFSCKISYNMLNKTTGVDR